MYKMNTLVDDRLILLFLAMYYGYQEDVFKIYEHEEFEVKYSMDTSPRFNTIDGTEIPITIDAIERK